MDDIGLENSADSRGKQHVGQNPTPNPTLTSFTDADLDTLIDAWPTLNEATKAKIIKLVGIAIKR